MKRLGLPIVLLFFLGCVNGVFGQAGRSQDESGSARTTTLSYGIVVDNSGAYRRILDRVINAVLDVAEAHSPDDEAFLVTFIDVSKTVVRQDFTSEKSELRDAAEEMYIEGGRTATLDALLFSAKYLLESENHRDGRRRALLLVSDGDDRESSAKFDEVADFLKKNEIRVYSIGIADGRVNEKLLTRLAKSTSGKAAMPRTPTGVKNAVAEIFADLRRN